jgi:hypothetical protein
VRTGTVAERDQTGFGDVNSDRQFVGLVNPNLLWVGRSRVTGAFFFTAHLMAILTAARLD